MLISASAAVWIHEDSAPCNVKGKGVVIWADGLYHLQLLLGQRRAPRHPLAANPKFGCSFGYCEPSGIMVVRGKRNLDFRNSFIGTWISRPCLPRSGSANDCTSLRKRNVTHHRCAGLVNVSRKVFDFTLVPTNNFFAVFQHHFRFGVLPYYIKNLFIPSALLLTSPKVYQYTESLDWIYNSSPNNE
jgi:hypothetical protein